MGKDKPGKIHGFHLQVVDIPYLLEGRTVIIPPKFFQTPTPGNMLVGFNELVVCHTRLHWDATQFFSILETATMNIDKRCRELFFVVLVLCFSDLVCLVLYSWQ